MKKVLAILLALSAAVVLLSCAAGCRQPLLQEDSEVAAVGPEVVALIPPSQGQSYDSLVRRHLGNGNYHEAFRTLPKAMAQWAQEEEEAGHSFEGAAGQLCGSVMLTTAEAGDSAWGEILDDPEIPYRYKTKLTFEILEARLGKGAVYSGDDNFDNFVVPVNRPIDLDKERLRLVKPTD